MTEHIIQFFAYEHLPPHLQEVSKPFAQLARSIVAPPAAPPDAPHIPLGQLGLPANDQRTLALTLLLQAKDAAVRPRPDPRAGRGRRRCGTT